MKFKNKTNNEKNNFLPRKPPYWGIWCQNYEELGRAYQGKRETVKMQRWGAASLISWHQLRRFMKYFPGSSILGGKMEALFLGIHFKWVKSSPHE